MEEKERVEVDKVLVEADRDHNNFEVERFINDLSTSMAVWMQQLMNFAEFWGHLEVCCSQVQGDAFSRAYPDWGGSGGLPQVPLDCVECIWGLIEFEFDPGKVSSNKRSPTCEGDAIEEFK